VSSLGQIQREATQTASEIGRSRWVGWLGRIGLVAKGVSYALVAVLAVLVATGAGGRATDREGALEIVAQAWYGRVLILALAAGFVAYALWRGAQAVLDRANEGTDGSGAAKRIGYLGRALLYGGLAATALTLLDGTGNDSTQTQQARESTAEVLTWPAGRWLVGAVGAAFVAAALFNAYRAVTQKFEEKWYVDDLSERAQRAVSGVSSIGLMARFVAFGLIGLFLVRAAYQYDPDEAIGLDGALRKLADGSYGGALLGALAGGLLCYALFCLVEARYRRV
jgi:hypothetical protein